MALLGEAAQQQKVRGEIREKATRVLQPEEAEMSDPPSDVPTSVPSDMPSDAPSMMPSTAMQGAESSTSPAASPTGTTGAAEGASGAFASGLGLTVASMAFVAFL